MTRLQQDQRGMCPDRGQRRNTIMFACYSHMHISFPSRRRERGSEFSELQQPVCELNCQLPLPLEVAPVYLNNSYILKSCSFSVDLIHALKCIDQLNFIIKYFLAVLFWDDLINTYKFNNSLTLYNSMKYLHAVAFKVNPDWAFHLIFFLLHEAYIRHIFHGNCGFVSGEIKASHVLCSANNVCFLLCAG